MRCYFSLYVTGNTAVASRHCQLVSFHAYLPNIDSWLFHFQFFQLFLFGFVLEIKYFGYTTDILEMSTLKCFSSFIAISDTNHIIFSRDPWAIYGLIYCHKNMKVSVKPSSKRMSVSKWGVKKIPVFPVSYREKIRVGNKFFFEYFFHGFGGFLLGDLHE
jgi:hypothetical protein